MLLNNIKYMMYYYNNDFFPFHIFGSIFMVIFWVFFAFLIISLLRRGHYHHLLGDHSMEILKERYAKGEITKEQFETMKKDLQR